MSSERKDHVYEDEKMLSTIPCGNLQGGIHNVRV